MAETDNLRRMYEDELLPGPFPSHDCAVAQIDGKVHGDLVMYLADIAGLASRGESGLASLPESEKGAFRKLASRSFYERHPALRRRITPDSTPTLHALMESTERARQLIMQAL